MKLDRAGFGARLVAQAAPALPVDRYVTGKPVDEVTALLPRLFNLCRGAQTAAVAAALGRPADTQAVAAEILRDHLLKLQVTWPAFFGVAPKPLPEDWQAGGPALLRALFGRDHAPRTPEDFRGFLDGGATVAAPLRRIADGFRPGEAVAEGLPEVTLEAIWDGGPMENSVAMRHAAHPVMRHLAARFGRGPLWRAAARLYDLEAAALGHLPEVMRGPNAAMVPAARGAYAVQVETAHGRVTAFHRVTPTDALLEAGGILDCALASLPADKGGLGPLLLDILDPCCPVRLKEVSHA